MENEIVITPQSEVSDSELYDLANRYIFIDNAPKMRSGAFRIYGAERSGDDIILDIVAERVSKEDCAQGFILDGVPRTLAQAKALDARDIHIDHVISIEIDDDVIEGRMTGRRVCSKCGASYHVVANPPKAEGICDLCQGELMIRKDDAAETVRHRLEVYHAQTEVLKDYYAKQGKLCLVEGNQSIEGANGEILAAIGAKV